MRTLFAVTRTKGPAWDASQPMRSQTKWNEHAVFMDSLAASGFIVLGGPIGYDGDVLLIIDTVEEDAIRSRLADDPWTPMGLLEIKDIKRWTILLESTVHP